MTARDLILCLIGLLASGCSGANDAGSQPVPATDPSHASPPTSEAIEPDISVQVASWDEVQRSIQASRGKVAILDLWSTW